VVKAHDSVAVVLYHTDKHRFLIVRQFRPALYAAMLRGAGITDTQGSAAAPPLAGAFTCELCAGIVDKDMSLADTAREEIHEECGFDVPVDNIKQITSYIAGVGTQGATQSSFFAQ
jgi:UDP-sugar diphosphatase